MSSQILKTSTGLLILLSTLGGVGLPQSVVAQSGEDVCVMRERRVRAGKWETLETYWNAVGHAYFRAPENAKIKVRYGVGWFGKDRQKQTLNGREARQLKVSKWSKTYARMQIKAPSSTVIYYTACSRGIA